MSDNQFLTLLSEEGRRAHLESDFLPSKEQGTRNKNSVSGLKTKGSEDVAYKFLKLTPEPRTKSVDAHNGTDGAGQEGKSRTKNGDSGDGAAMSHNAKNASAGHVYVL